MIFSRLFSIILRISQFVFAAIVLGLTAYFLSQHQDEDDDWRGGRGRGRGDDDGFDSLLGRLIYSVIWSALSLIFAIVWVIPTTSSMTGFASDLIFTAGWAAVFGLLVDWFNDVGCGSPWAWRNGFSFRREDACGQWRAAQAFSFLSMIVWLATALLGIIMVLRLRRRAAAPSRV
jgi:hypothetical protein